MGVVGGGGGGSSSEELSDVCVQETKGLGPGSKDFFANLGRADLGMGEL